MNLPDHPKKGETLLSDIRSEPSTADALRAWWLGQSGFLVRWRNETLLFDPYLSDSLTHKYAKTDKPHTRISERVIDPAQFEGIGVVTSSHNHTDHLDAETLVPLFRTNPNLRLVLPTANIGFAAERLGMSPDAFIGLDDSTSAKIGSIEFYGIPAAHNTLDRDAAGRCLYIGFIVKFGPWTLYHSGDTLRYEGMAKRLARFSIDLAFLPINGNKPERRVAGNLDGKEAAELARDIGAKLVVPCHYDMFEFNTASPELFETTCRSLGQPYRILRPGECVEIPR